MHARNLLTLWGGADFTYYVDSVNGSDSNNGLSPATAKQTIAGLPTLAAGDSVGLARGSSWNEQLTISVANIRVGAYGSGAKPVLDASDVHNSGWVQDGTFTNCWSKSITFTSYEAAGRITVFEDGAFLAKRTTLADCNANPGSYYASNFSPTGAQTVYIHPSGSGNPNTNGKEYRVPVRAHAIDAHGQAGVILDGIEARRGFHKDGAIKTGDDSVVRGCVANYGTIHNLYVGEGSLIENCTVKYALFTGESNAYIVANKTSPTGKPVTLRNNVVGEDVYNSTATGFYCHNNSGNASQLFGAVLLEDNTWQNIGVAITAFHIPSLTANREIFNDVRMAVRGDAAVVYELNDCTYTNLVQQARYAQANANGCTIRLNRCTLSTPLVYDGLLYMFNRSGETFEVRECRFTLTGNTGNRWGLWVNGTSPNATLRLYDTDWIGEWATYEIDFGANTGATFEGDRNCYPTSFRARINSTDYLTLAAWQTATGQDANSTTGAC